MGPMLLTHLVSALARQLSRRPPVHRCLSALTSAPSRGLLEPSRASPLRPRSPGAPTQPRGSLLGQCQHLAGLQPSSFPSSAGMKTKSSLKLRCQDCFFVRRRGRLFVFCKTHPRHKQRQG